MLGALALAVVRLGDLPLIVALLDRMETGAFAGVDALTRAVMSVASRDRPLSGATILISSASTFEMPSVLPTAMTAFSKVD